MKKIMLVIYVFVNGTMFAQNVGIGTNSPHPSAILELNASDRGLLPPRLSSAQREAIMNPATGLMVFDSDINTLFLYNGVRWVSIEQTNSFGTSNAINNIYTFTAPQFLSTYTTPFPSLQGVSISEGLIISCAGISTSNNVASVSWNINRSGVSGPGVVHTVTTTMGGNNVFCYDADSLENNVYAVINNALFRLNLNTPADVAKIADSLGTVKQLKVLINGDVILTTTLNNGSLMRVQPNGVKQVIAANLRFPTFFDIFNGEYYVSITSALTGSVVKVTPAGVVSNILTDILTPRSIVFDKYNNFILQTSITLGGSNYINYTIYSATGQLIGPVNDQNDNAIISNSVYPSAMYVDNFNNLVFPHYTAASNPPNPTSNNFSGVWILKMQHN